MLGLLRRHRVVYDLSLPGVELEEVTLEGHAFYACNFAFSRLSRCRFVECSFELCFLDSSVVAGCTFDGAEIRSCTLALASFTDTQFVHSNLIQCNFNGATGDYVSFGDCDLLHSRFDAVQVPIQFVNCNVKQTRFLRSAQELFSFRRSNQEDAVFAAEDEP